MNYIRITVEIGLQRRMKDIPKVKKREKDKRYKLRSKTEKHTRMKRKR